MITIEQLKEAGEAPDFMNYESYATLSKGYLHKGETPKGMYKRLAHAAASRLNRPDLEPRFFEILYKNWLCPASPICANLGSDKGLPISCNSIHIHDSLDNILQKNHELGMLSKHGSGVGIYLGDLRGHGTPVKGTGGVSDGVMAWAKIYESTIVSTNQGGTRRGSAAAYLDINHPDIDDFLQMRNPVGDASKRTLNLSHGVCIDDNFMNSLAEGNQRNRQLWEEILLRRFESGEPYLFFNDNVNSQNPDCYKDKGLTVKTSNICLSGDSLVVTNEGPEKIKDLVGKTVVIWDGQAWVSNDKFIKTGSDELYRIHLSDGSFIDATENHKWYTKPPTKRESEVKSYIQTTTKDLVPGHKLEYHNVESHGSVTVASAYAKGFLAAEGTSIKISQVSKDYKPICFVYEPKKMVINRLIASIEESPVSEGLRSDAKETVSSHYSEKEGRYSISGLSARRSLTPWTREHKTKLPSEWFKWSKESKLEFMAGLFDGDGCYMKGAGGYQITSIHKEFLNDLQMMLKSVRIKSTISIASLARTTDFKDGYGEYDCKEAWRLTISSYWAYNFSEIMNFTRLVKYDKKKPDRFCADFARVVSVEKLPGEHDTYCTNVETTHKFALSNGIISGNCNEIFLHTDHEHTFVCCLSSLNLARWEEWKDTDTVELSIMFLDAVMEEYIQKARNIRGFESAVRFAEKSRALGLGVLGWASLLQKKMLPFDSFDSMMLNALIFKTIRTKAEKATKDLAEAYGEPEWCKGHNRRNTHVLAVAPTASNSIIAGGYSPGIEPNAANIFVLNSAKGTFIRRNVELDKYLTQIGCNTVDVWERISKDAGSVLNIQELSPEAKEVFKTAREINQFAIIKQAGQRQKYIDQGQSLNLFFGANASPDYVHEVHMEAWKQGLKGLYYCRTGAVLRGDLANRDAKECAACEG